jgi:aldehyde:ferredoxin oxidoreductase
MITQYGYAGKILKVDLSSQRMIALSTSDYADGFLGGRGIAAKFYWDKMPPGADAFDSQNVLVFVTGPLAGFRGLSGSRWQVCGKTPAMFPQHFSYANLEGGVLSSNLLATMQSLSGVNLISPCTSWSRTALLS